MTDDMTRVVVRRHLAAWQRGDVPTLLADYADDAVILSGMAGSITGKDVIAGMYNQIFSSMFPRGDTMLETSVEVISGEYALVQWTAKSSIMRAENGFETFTLRNGKIVCQCGGADFIPVG